MSGVFWLASYPRSGSTWIRLLIQSCQQGGSHVAINALSVFGMATRSRADFDETLGVFASDLVGEEVLQWRPAVLRARVAQSNRPAFLKTHDARLWLANGEYLVPADVTRGAVYLVRDPRDVAVSLSRFLRVDIDRAITIMADTNWQSDRSERQLYPLLPDCWSDWSTNIESWLDGPGIRPELVRYEDLLADPVAVLVRCLPVLGQGFPLDTIRRAVAVMHLENLRADERAHGFKERPPGMADFFGPGRIGGWRQSLQAEQAARIESVHGRMMSRLGYLS